MIVNTNELATTEHAKFGNGILKEGEDESIRIWLEVCNENGGRSIIPFNGMLPGDAWLWSRFRDNAKLQNKFKEFTASTFDNRRGYYGKIGDRTVIKNCKIIKDVWIGSDAYLKGANKLKNLTINSSPEAASQIGEGCELVNGIVGFGCRIFYGVKAVRFIMASHSQLKYGARLINSYLGNNATISCCEVLNSLIFPAHEQHHNNSFLCAALVMGQSNMAAGATIGSNHNSRSADGEIVAGRGFWPGLCVSLKHNSRFASFAILAKGDYPAELDIPIPFALISNDVSNDELTVMPAYWFLHNMYALARNSWKYTDRDRRTDKTQLLEFDFLAPDTIGEMLTALHIMEELTGPNSGTETEVHAPGWENSDRKVKLIKVPQACAVFKDLIAYYAATLLLSHIKKGKIASFEDLLKSLPASPALTPWVNVGGQLIRSGELDKLIGQIENGKIRTWNEIHDFYRRQGEQYPADKLRHALAALRQLTGSTLRKAGPKGFANLLRQAIATRNWMANEIYATREKDYSNPFRQMVYESDQEMNAVIGRLEDNSFIRQEKEAAAKYKKEIEKVLRKFGL